MKREANVSPAVRALRRAVPDLEPRVGIVVGSGLGALAAAVDDARKIRYVEIPGFPRSTVAGHAGELVAGRLEGAAVILQSGRLHLYEGHSAADVVLPIRVFAELGVEVLVLTNAAGAVRASLRPPTLMLVSDHLNLQWRNALVGPAVAGERTGADLSIPYDPTLRALARETARAERIRLEEGVYAGVLGPSYETPTEIAMLRRLGADAVGMSTVPEALVAHARGLRVLALSSITNLGAGLSETPLRHEDVVEAGGALAADLERLVRGVLRGLQE